MHICLPVWLTVVNLVVEVWREKGYKQTAALAMWWNHACPANEAKEGKLVCSIVACSTLCCAHAVFLALSAYSLPLLCVRGCAGSLASLV